MKKILVLTMALFMAISMNAQFWMGGSLGANFTKFNDNMATLGYGDKTQTSLSFRPEVGYSLNDKWDICLGLGYGKLINANGIKDKTCTEFLIAPYASYTFAKVGQVEFYVDGGVDFGTHKVKDDDYTQKTFWVGVRPGVRLMLTDKVWFEAQVASLGYRSVQDETKEFGLNVDNNALQFGMYWSF